MDKKIERSDFSVFWERTLSAHQCAAITEIVHEFGLQYDLEHSGFIRPAWRRAREIRAEELGLDRSRLVHEGAEAPRVKSAYG